MDRAYLQTLEESVSQSEIIGKRLREWTKISALLTKMGQGPVEIGYNLVTSMGL